VTDSPAPLPLPHLKPAEFRAISQELTPRVLNAVRAADYSGLPQAASFALRPLLRKGFALSRETNQSDLISAVTLLGVYGQHERAAEAASLLLEIPTDRFWVPNTGILRMVVGSAYYFARADGSDLAGRLQPHLIRPPDYRPHANIFTTRFLTPYLDEPFPYGDLRSAYPAWHDAMLYLRAIAHFSYAWIFGGGGEWPIVRLEQEIERYRQAIFREPGFAVPVV